MSKFKKTNKPHVVKRRGSFAKKEPFIKVINSNQSNRSIVAPDNTPLHLKRRWTQRAGGYHGYYRTQFGAWKGEIRKSGDIFKVYIYDPPTKKLESHKRWICFHHIKGKKWRIKLAINPTDNDLGAIIFYVESIIIESFQNV
jgi:hypothetical protein